MAKLTAIQMQSVPDIDANLAFVDQQLSTLSIAAEHLVVLPECCLFFGGRDKQQLDIAEPIGAGKMQQGLQQLARKYAIYLLAGSIPTQGTGEKFQATSVLFAPDGSLLANYQKLHLFDVDVEDSEKSYRESAYTDAGLKVVQQPLQDIQLGLSICYDLRFPALFQQLAALGANVIAVPAAFTQVTGKAHWQPLLQARAIENQCYIVAAGQSGEHKNGRQTYGHSMIIDPWGEVVCCLTDELTSITAPLDLDLLKRVRQSIPVAKHNRFNCSLNSNEP
ncbi:carbon-nitrogen hydrolase family protein [Thalassotalea sp. Y01]|uniref:carbon-nitrogen hydrolase family protein n=1 Tax=Thalassotalea sp. Y01 TaxID=2729613 RepID=UPI00145EF58F|nr:carbon-nitrogen hydrolase family protein [Thalassotalea sp. Y01]NMP15713.1 carbon-nitrogen hydrolase family protein [Thalassotalea sp. Y01]